MRLRLQCVSRRAGLPVVLGVCVGVAAFGQEQIYLSGVSGGTMQSGSSRQAGGMNDVPDPPPVAIDHVHGVVVNSVDGKPVPRVLVTSTDRRMATMTDGDGRFGFDLRHLVPGPASGGGGAANAMSRALYQLGQTTVSLNLRRPGFIANSVPLALSFDAGVPQPEVQLKLVPEGVIRGQLYASEGEGPAGILVQLVRRQVQDGLARWMVSGSAQANARGEFRFAELAAGDYKIMTRQVAERAFGLPAVDEQHGYAASYSGGAMDLGSAAAIHVNAGQTVDVGLTLRHGTFYHVSIPLAGVPSGSGLNVQVGDDGVFGGSLGVRAGNQKGEEKQGQAVEGFLPDGVYDVRISTAMNPQQAGSSARVRLTVAGSAVKTGPVSLVPMASIPVVVREEFTASQSGNQSANAPLRVVQPGAPPTVPPRVNLTLQAVGTTAMRMSSAMLPPGATAADTMVLPNVEEGTYRVSVFPTHGGYVASMRSNGVDLMRNPLAVGPNGASAPIEVTVRDDNQAMVNGTVTGLDPTQAVGTPGASSQAAGAQTQAAARQLGTQVFVTCVSLEDFYGAQIRQISSTDGKFVLGLLTPGEYLVLASRERLQDFEFRNEEVLRQYLSKGTVLTVSVGQQQTSIQVPLMDGEGN